MNKIYIEKIKENFVLEKPDKLETQTQRNVTKNLINRTGKCVTKCLKGQ